MGAQIQNSTRQIFRIELLFFKLHVLESSFECTIFKFTLVVIADSVPQCPIHTCGGWVFRTQIRISTRAKGFLSSAFSNSYTWSSTKERIFSGISANPGWIDLMASVRALPESAGPLWD
jgi:hypothetical protein